MQYGLNPIPGYLGEKTNQFYIISPSNEHILLEKLFTFSYSSTNKKYIVYTSNEYYEDGELKIYASIYKQNGHELILYPILSEDEWAMVQYYLDEYNEMLKDVN